MYDYSWFCLPLALRAIKGSTPNVQLSHNNPMPCEPWIGLIQFPVKHYVTFIIHRQQLCILSKLDNLLVVEFSGRVLPLLNTLLGYQIQHVLVSVRLRLLRWYTRNCLLNSPTSLNSAFGCSLMLMFYTLTSAWYPCCIPYPLCGVAT